MTTRPAARDTAADVPAPPPTRCPGRRPKVLVTGGRAPAALELARLLAASGCEVHAAESLRFHLCRTSKAVARSHRVPSPARDPEGFIGGLERIVRGEGIDWIVPTCEELFYVSAGLGRLGRMCRVLAAPLPQLRRLHSKWEFIGRAERYGFAVPHTRLLRTARDWNEWAETFADPPADGGQPEFADGCVLKPEFSRSGSQVVYLPTRRHIAEALNSYVRGAGDSLKPPPYADGRAWVAQRLLRGRPVCTYSVVHEGRLAAHCAYAAAYSVGGGACVHFEPLAHPGLREWVRRFAELERFSGQLAFDFIEAEDGTCYPIECNPRATSGIHLFAGDERFASALLEPEPPNGAIVEPLPSAKGMLALPMLLYGWRGVRSRDGWRAWLKRLVSTPDVVFRRADWRPFREQLPMLNELRRIAAAEGKTLVEATTGDIEWNGDGR